MPLKPSHFQSSLLEEPSKDPAKEENTENTCRLTTPKKEHADALVTQIQNHKIETYERLNALCLDGLEMLLLSLHQGLLLIFQPLPSTTKTHAGSSNLRKDIQSYRGTEFKSRNPQTRKLKHYNSNSNHMCLNLNPPLLRVIDLLCHLRWPPPSFRSGSHTGSHGTYLFSRWRHMSGHMRCLRGIWLGTLHVFGSST